MLLIIYSCYQLEKFIKTKKFLNFLLNLSILLILTLSLMFVAGYFESSPINAVSTGYGYKKLDLLGFFDPKISDNQSWSIFFPDLFESSLEGFNYLGAGNLLLILIAISILFKKKLIGEKINLEINVFFKISNIFVIIFLFWSLSNNISFGGYEIINIELPKFLFGALSIFSSTGRFAWPVIYFLMFFSLLVLFREFKNKILKYLISFIVILQLIDTFSGINKNSLRETRNTLELNKDAIWIYINDNYKKIRTTYHFNNYGPIFSKFSRILPSMNNIETDIILNAAMDRQKSAAIRYKFIKQIEDGDIPKDTVYIIDNLGHLKQLKHSFKKENISIINRDGFWLMLPGYKNQMTLDDIKQLENIKFDQIILNKKNKVNFKGEYLGFGWTHNFGNAGAWTEGNNSYLIFKLPESVNNKLEFKMNFQTYNNKNKKTILNIYINEKKREIDLIRNIDLKELNFTLDNEDVNNENIVIKFNFENLRSPYDNFESPDARKLGILLKDFTIKEK